MTDEQKFDVAISDPTIASITLSGMIFDKFMRENNNDLQDDYLDYLNSTDAPKDEKYSYPQYCYAVFAKVAVETYLEENGIRSDS